MESLKEKVEKASGDKFIEWLNQSSGQEFHFKCRADEAPDLIYTNGVSEVGIEHTGAYYDHDHASFLWKGARNPEAEDKGHWEGVNPDISLSIAVKNCIEAKAAKDYGKNCVLLIEIPPGVTGRNELEELLLPLPEGEGMEKFIGIYVAGTFPFINGIGGGYHVLTIKPIRS